MKNQNAAKGSHVRTARQIATSQNISVSIEPGLHDLHELLGKKVTVTFLSEYTGMTTYFFVITTFSLLYGHIEFPPIMHADVERVTLWIGAKEWGVTIENQHQDVWRRSNYSYRSLQKRPKTPKAWMTITK